MVLETTAGVERGDSRTSWLQAGCCVGCLTQQWSAPEGPPAKQESWQRHWQHDHCVLNCGQR